MIATLFVLVGVPLGQQSGPWLLDLFSENQRPKLSEVWALYRSTSDNPPVSGVGPFESQQEIEEFLQKVLKKWNYEAAYVIDVEKYNQHWDMVTRDKDLERPFRLYGKKVVNSDMPGVKNKFLQRIFSDHLSS